jgi:general stress protein YciG
MLVTARLWRRVKGGYRFHEWAADGDGTRRNPTKDEVEEDRRKKAEAGRKGGLASGKARSKTEARASPNASAGARGLVEPPTRPDPTEGRVGGTGDLLGGTAVTRASPEPPRQCLKHADDPDPPPCGPCADARRARERWDLAEAERKRNAPKCPKHRGQPADGCGLCRSDLLGAE